MNIDNLQKYFTFFCGTSTFIVLISKVIFTETQLKYIQGNQYLNIFFVYVVLPVWMISFLAIIFKSSLEKFYQKVLLKRGHFESNFIYENVFTRIEFVNNQNLICYKEESEIKILKSKIYYDYDRIKWDGKIIENTISAYNCHYKLDINKKEIEIINVLDKKKSHEKNIHASMFFFVEESFNNQEEYWEIKFKNYSRIYRLKIVFHPEKKPINFKFVKKNIDGSEESTQISPIRTYENGKDIISLVILGIEKNDVYRLIWKW